MPNERKNQQEQVVINTSDPCYCPACGKLTFSCFPVHLRELDGNDTLVCHIVKCAICDRVKHYGTQWAVGKLKGRVMYCDYAYWPELKRNKITPEQFLDAIFRHPEGHIWLDARNGLEKVMPEGNQAEALKRLQAFFSRNGRGLVRV